MLKTHSKEITAIYTAAARILSEGALAEKDMDLVMEFYKILLDRLKEEDWDFLRRLIS